MTVTITDPATLAALAGATTPVDLIGPDGRVIGFFFPPVEVEFPESGLTEAELQRRENAPSSECVSGEVVMARLRELRDRA